MFTRAIKEVIDAAVPFFNYAQAVTKRGYRTLQKGAVPTELGQIIVRTGDYQIHPAVTDHHARTSNDYFKAVWTAELGVLPKNSLVIICKPTLFAQKEHKISITDPGHNHSYITDDAGEVVIETHTDFTRGSAIEVKEKQEQKRFYAEFGYSNRKEPALAKSEQITWPGLYVSHSVRQEEEYRIVRNFPNQEVGIIILPGFNKAARDLVIERITALIGEDYWLKPRTKTHEHPYVLSGGESVKSPFEVHEPFNCGVFMFEVTKARSPHAHSTLRSDDEFKDELFRASPANAIALLVEQRYGIKPAQEVVTELAKNAAFSQLLLYSKYRDYCRQELTTPKPF